MRVLLLSWEYPPVMVGGLGRHVHALARRLAQLGNDVTVLCRQPEGTDAATHPTELTDCTELAGCTGTGAHGRLRVLRAAEDPMPLHFSENLVAWTLAMGHAMTRALLRLHAAGWHPDVVHAHDWLVTHPAVTARELYDVPLVSTVHATEAGRHGGWVDNPLKTQIHAAEWWLTRASDMVITCSQAMRAEVVELFDLKPEFVRVLHNGIDSPAWQVSGPAVSHARSRYGPGPLLLYFGRLEWEKGVGDLLDAMPAIRGAAAGTRLVVAGSGRTAAQLREQSRQLGVEDAVDLVGHLPDDELAALLRAVDAVVLPSRYEPFGIVALEAAAAGAPLVCSTAGGLGELVEHGHTGASFPPGDPAAIAEAVTEVLADPASAAMRARAAAARLPEEFDWTTIAGHTVNVYRTAGRDSGQLTTASRPVLPAGNVFHGSS